MWLWFFHMTDIEFIVVIGIYSPFCGVEAYDSVTKRAADTSAETTV